MSSSTKKPPAPLKRRKTARAPETCPEIPPGKRLKSAIQRVSQNFSDQVFEALSQGLPTDAQRFRDLESTLLRLCGQILVGPVIAEVVKALHAYEPFVLFCIAQARLRADLRLGTDREVELFVTGGQSFKVPTPYALLNPERRPGPKTQLGKRGGGGGGVYPVLGQLGFLDRNSPYVASLVTRLATELDSFESARQALQDHGIELLVPQIQAISERVADAGRYVREFGLSEFRLNPPVESSCVPAESDIAPTCQSSGPVIRPLELAGKRVVVLFDGGRARTRITKPGRRKKSGAHGYETPWREPKLMTVYTLNARGEKSGDAPFYEGTFASWEEAFDIYAKILIELGAKDAEVLQVGADGSLNIWDHVDALIKRTGIAEEKVRRFVDVMHAMGKIGELAKLNLDTPDEKKRAQWQTKLGAELKKGHFDKLLKELEDVKVAKASKNDKEKIINYLRSRRELMKYRGPSKKKCW